MHRQGLREHAAYGDAAYARQPSQRAASAAGQCSAPRLSSCIAPFAASYPAAYTSPRHLPPPPIHKPLLYVSLHHNDGLRPPVAPFHDRAFPPSLLPTTSIDHDTIRHYSECRSQGPPGEEVHSPHALLQRWHRQRWSCSLRGRRECLLSLLSIPSLSSEQRVLFLAFLTPCTVLRIGVGLGFTVCSCPDVARSPSVCRPCPPRLPPSGPLRKVHVSSTPPTASMDSSAQTAGYLVFLLFLPLLSTLWIWVHMILPLLSDRKLTHGSLH